MKPNAVTLHTVCGLEELSGHGTGGVIALGYGQVHILSLPLLRALEDDA